jgi:hypothetical protein
VSETTSPRYLHCILFTVITTLRTCWPISTRSAVEFIEIDNHVKVYQTENPTELLEPTAPQREMVET